MAKNRYQSVVGKVIGLTKRELEMTPVDEDPQLYIALLGARNSLLELQKQLRRSRRNGGARLDVPIMDAYLPKNGAIKVGHLSH